MKLTEEEARQIHQFYGWIRDYLADLSRSTTGDLSHAINFGYWPNTCENLYDAQMAFCDLIAELLSPLEEGMHGVEVGCGIGGYAIRLLEKHPVELICYDLLQEHLDITRRYAEKKSVEDRLHTIQGNSMNMESIEDNSLDFMYSVESSFHYDEKQKFFNEVFRVLKPGAVFAYADISCEDISRIAFKDGNHFSSKLELDEYINTAGLTIDQHRDIGEQVYEPLYDYTARFNDEILDAPPGSTKAKVGKYWDLVNSNYTKLYRQGKMGYQVYRLSK